MKINPIIFGVLVLVVFFGVIGVAQASGNWSVSGQVGASDYMCQLLPFRVRLLLAAIVACPPLQKSGFMGSRRLIRFSLHLGRPPLGASLSHLPAACPPMRPPPS